MFLTLNKYTNTSKTTCFANCLCFFFLWSLYIQPSSCLEGAITEVGCDETPSEVRVFCNVRNGTATPDGGDGNAVGRDGHFRSKYCRLTLPRDAKILSLAYGRGTARYSYHGATYNDCGVSFAKPLRRSEIGRWKCMNAMSDDRVYGGFVVVVPPNNTKGIRPTTIMPTTDHGDDHIFIAIQLICSHVRICIVSIHVSHIRHSLTWLVWRIN